MKGLGLEQKVTEAVIEKASVEKLRVRDKEEEKIFSPLEDRIEFDGNLTVFDKKQNYNKRL